MLKSYIQGGGARCPGEPLPPVPPPMADNHRPCRFDLAAVTPDCSSDLSVTPGPIIGDLPGGGGGGRRWSAVVGAGLARSALVGCQRPVTDQTAVVDSQRGRPAPLCL